MDAMAFDAAPAASLNGNHVRIREAFVHDDFVLQCGRAQGRVFLRTGIVPKVGQRVDLTVFLDSRDLGHSPFRLSGEVTSVQPMPTWKVGGENRRAVSPGAVWRPSSSPSDCGPMGGSTLLAYIIKKKIPRERAMPDGSIPDLNGIWDRVVTTVAKEELTKRVIGKFGALHGQRVVCEGRWVSSSLRPRFALYSPSTHFSSFTFSRLRELDSISIMTFGAGVTKGRGWTVFLLMDATFGDLFLLLMIAWRTSGGLI